MTTYCARDRHDDCDGRVGIAGGDDRPACGCLCHTNLAQLLADGDVPRDRDEAVNMLAAIIEVIGLGFHPDTSGENYVERRTGRPTFTRRQARAYDRLMDRIYAVLPATGDSIYGTDIDICVIMGLIPDEL